VGQGGAGPGEAEQGRAGQGRAGQDGAGRGGTIQAGQDRATGGAEHPQGPDVDFMLHLSQTQACATDDS